MAGPTGRLRLAPLLACLLWVGCVGSDALDEQRRRLDQEHVERLQALDRIEARLVQAAGVTLLWRELGERRETVTEIACESAASHAEGMARSHDKQAARLRHLTRLAQVNSEREAEPEGKQQGL